MPKKKAAVNCKILPWLSARHDCTEGRFMQIGNSLFLSRKSDAGKELNKFVSLTGAAKLVYLCMALESGGHRAFRFPLSAAKKYGISATTLRRSIDELIAAGMITKQSGKNIRQPNEYEFGFAWKPP